MRAGRLIRPSFARSDPIDRVHARSQIGSECPAQCAEGEVTSHDEHHQRHQLSSLSGCYTALITPFRDGEIDEPALRTLVQRQIAGGVSGLLFRVARPAKPRRSPSEWDRVVSVVVETAAGACRSSPARAPTTRPPSSSGRARARTLGADGALVVTPYYNRPTQDGLYRHFAAIAEAVDPPVVLYNVPGRTGVNLLPETVVRLADIPGIVGIKEASGSLDQASQIVREAPDAFVVVSGDDSLTLPMMGVGASGVISVVSNIAPEAVSALTSACLAGNFGAAGASPGALRSLPCDVRRDKPDAGEGRSGAAGILLAGGAAAAGPR